MRMLMILALTVLVTGSAAASEKQADVRDVHAVDGGRVALAGTLDAGSPVYDRAFNNNPPASTTCSHPLTDAASDGQYYAVFCLEATDDQPVEILVNEAGTTIEDTFLALYCDPFDPLLPLASAVFTDDDDGVGMLSAITVSDNVVLNPSWQYFVVVTTYDAGATGDFSVTTSDNLIECSVPVDAATWSSLKDLYRYR